MTACSYCLLFRSLVLKRSLGFYEKVNTYGCINNKKETESLAVFNWIRFQLDRLFQTSLCKHANDKYT